MEIYNQLPEELQNKVFYFMSHPCADMIKSSLHFNPKEYIHPYFLISKKIKFWNQFWINNKDESWWDGLKDKIRREREMDAQWKERKLMDKNDYDAETGRTVNDDSETEDDSDDDSESSEDNNSDDSESESSEGNRNDNESESSEGDNNDNDNESVSSDPDPDDEYAECADDPELEYLFISEGQEFDHYDPYYAYLG